MRKERRIAHKDASLMGDGQIESSRHTYMYGRWRGSREGESECWITGRAKILGSFLGPLASGISMVSDINCWCLIIIAMTKNKPLE